MTVHSKDRRRVFRATGFTAAILTFVLGALGSGFWDLILGPNLRRLGRAIASVFTFGSDTLRDGTYGLAALASASDYSFFLVVLLPLMIPALAFAPAVWVLHLGRSQKSVPASEATPAEVPAWIVGIDTTDGGEGESFTFRHRLLRNVAYGANGLLLGAIIVTVMYGSLVSRSFQVRRTFELDLTIVAPFLTDQEEEILWSRFVRIRTRAEFMEVHQQLQRVANSNGVSLTESELW